MSYLRVIPRDLFNEANFLKCLGRIALLIEDGMAPDGLVLHHSSPERGFEIAMDSGSGDLMMSNMVLVSKSGRKAWLHRLLNSRDEWPVYIVDYNGDDEIEVFNQDATFTAEFLAWSELPR